MHRVVQLLLPLGLPDEKIQFSSEDEAKVVAAAAELLLEILRREEGEEVENERQS
jgi:hypothetical protein